MASSTAPNVVFIVGDNVGWGDIAWFVGPVAQCLGAVQQSMTHHRNVTSGEDFTCYT